ncbi:MAG TPA: glycosyltransferase family 4 protein [Candidatus Baltobacteraceae bacterium]
MSSTAQRIAHVASYGNPLPGSFIPALAALARALRERGDTTALVAADTPRASWHGQAAQAFASFTLARSHADVYRALRRFSPDIVHVHFVDYTLEASVAAYVGRARLYWHVHSAMPEAFTPYRRLRQKVKYAVVGGGVRGFVAVSEAMRAELQRWGAPGEKIAVVVNAVDTERFRAPSPSERAMAREALGIARQERVALFFGRDAYLKGGDVLWRALDFNLPIVVLAIGATVATIRELSKRVRVIDVPASADTVALYWAADVLVAPSRREGTPLVVLEALCCGLPVVASDIPAMAEIAKGTDAMRLVPNVPEQLARALREERAGDRAAIARSARRRYDLGRWVEEMMAVYAR